MLTAEFALLIGAALWLIGIRLRDPFNFGVNRSAPEFWWTAAAFFIGAFAPLGAILNLFEGSSDIDAFWRISPMVAIGLLMVVRNVARGARIEGHGLLLLLVLAIMLAQNIGSTALMAAVSLAVFLPGIVTPSSGYSLPAIRSGASVGISIFLLTLLAFALSGTAGLLGPCRSDKCSMWGLSLGEAGAGNAVGMVMAVMAAVTLLSAKQWHSVFLVGAGSFLLVDLTSSRSALNTWVIGVGVVAAHFISHRTGKRAFVGLATLTVATFVAIFPFMGWSPSAFTNRGALWLYARELISESMWFGHGSSFWVRGEATGSVDLNYATHNLALEMLVSAGIVGSVLLVLAVVLASRGRGYFESSIYTIALIGVTVGASATEVFSAPGRTYLMAGMAVMVFVAASARETDAATHMPVMRERVTQGVVTPR